jgi:ATP-dependent DNA helicase RecQ
VYEVLKAAPERSASLAMLAEAAALSDRRVKVVVAQLDAMGVARRQGHGATARVRLVRDFRDASELDHFATSYETRFETDREKLDDMMHYAQTTQCRVRFQATYFGELRDDDCEHCDNCRDHPAENAVHDPAPEAAPERVAIDAPPEPALPFACGDHVVHRRFGRGAVEEVTGEHVRVRFDRASVGTKVLSPEYLRAG